MPKDSVIDSQGRPHVFVVEDGRARSVMWRHGEEAHVATAQGELNSRSIERQTKELRSQNLAALDPETDLERAAELKFGRIPELEAKVAEQEARLDEVRAGGEVLLSDEVTEEDVAQVVAKWTGIPVSRLMEGEVEKLIQMEDRLHDRVIGQASPRDFAAAMKTRASLYVELSRPFTLVAPAIGFLSGGITAIGAAPAEPWTWATLQFPAIGAVMAAVLNAAFGVHPGRFLFGVGGRR